jgi:protein involved in polysaccharide export with SLBB domain
MDIPMFRWVNGDSCAVSARGIFHSRLYSFIRCGVYLLIFMLAVAACAQESLQNYDLQGTGTSNSEDCADPLLASRAACSNQSEDIRNQMAPQQGRSITPGQYGNGVQPPNSRNNYSDTEPLTGRAPREAQTSPVLPPEPLTEFQKFTASTAGQILPIYGASLFRHTPSTFAPLEAAPVPSDFVIGPGDELRIRIWGQLNFAANVRVDRSGDVYLPQVGPVHVAGLAFSDLQAHLRTAIQRVYHNFELSVDMGQIRSIQVYVTGEARRPGVYTVSSLSSLVDALFASGGPSTQGSLRNIELRRGSAVITNFDLYDLLLHGDKSKDVKLLPGDVLFIPPVGPQAAVMGSVRVPAIYELKPGESLADLIAAAGGVSAVAEEARISIERIENHRDRHAMEVAYDATGLATPVADGDLIRVYSIVPTYRKTVILRGNTANPGRFAWHPGMRISELIPDRESLTTRDYWWKRAQLGLPAPEFEATQNFADSVQPAENQPVTVNLRPSREAGAPYQAESLQQSQFGSQQDLNGESQNRDAYGISSSQDLNQQQRGNNSALASAQAAPSMRGPRPAQRTDVRLLAPEIDWDYAVIDRRDPDTLKTTLIPFDLGKLVLQHDASQDMELQPGDIVSVFSEADIRVPIAQQTKLVRLDGEFVHAGVYSVQPGETMRHLVDRAGGFTPNAYLYGSEFTRESTRAVQQAAIDEYLQNLEMQIQRSNLALVSSPVGSAQDLASGNAAQNSERELISRLRQVRATGRIVLPLKVDSSGTADLPNIPMQNGDTFMVPSVPDNINVIGAVHNQNSYLYSQGKRVGSYLIMAGGPNTNADKKHEFIIRADGEIVSRETKNGLWGNDFYNLQLNPGDTLVVPEKGLKPSALRGVIDWSQMFSQFALGAAALSVLR